MSFSRTMGRPSKDVQRYLRSQCDDVLLLKKKTCDLSTEHGTGHNVFAFGSRRMSSFLLESSGGWDSPNNKMFGCYQ